MTAPLSCGYVNDVTIKLGLQIPNFSYGTGVEELFPTVIAQAQEADAAGFDSVFVMDHFYQLPGLGTPDQPMLEAYTTLGGLATVTKNVQLGTLVTGNTYRNPTLLAKAITTLDVVSQGRAILGIGTGWFELEHDQLGFEFGTFTDRFNKLDEALQIILPMLRGERPTFSGKYYRAQEAMANPRFRDHIPLMIGGSGEKKTIPLAAKHFDHLNIITGFDELPRKVQVVKDRCEEIGRDPDTLKISVHVWGEDMSRPGAQRVDRLAALRELGVSRAMGLDRGCATSHDALEVLAEDARAAGVELA